MSVDQLEQPPGASADWTIPQNWSSCSVGEHAMWDRLFKRQSCMLRGRVVDSFEDLLEQTIRTDFAPPYRELEASGDLDVASVLPEDRLFTLGTRSYAAERASA